MSDKQYMATFAGNINTLMAIDEALSLTGDIINEYDLKKS